MTETINQSSTDLFKRYIPPITTFCCLVSVFLFVGINFEAKLDTWEAYMKWGAPSATAIFSGDYWGIISSNFLHVEIWHIAFNLYWLWIFGKKIEFETNKIFYAILILSSALVSSVTQLAFSDSTGIGLSGIGYSLFGFLLLKTKTTEEFKNYLDKKTINLFFIWLVLCVILTKTGAWTVGNAAHIGGLIWGATIAYTTRFNNYIQLLVGAAFLAISSSIIFWSPYSTSYLSYEAYELHRTQKLDEAAVIYKKILSRDPDNEFAKSNIRQLEVYSLEKQAVAFHLKQKYTEARRLYNKIIAIDKENELAKENLKRLPAK
jgi:membrane associated rhomboid family serine protease